MQRALDAILRRFITRGLLMLRWPDGREQIYAAPPRPAPVRKPGRFSATHGITRRLIFHPTLAFGEAYMNGHLLPLQGSIYDFLELIILNQTASGAKHPLMRLGYARGRLRRRIDQYNPASRAQRNVAHHYIAAKTLLGRPGLRVLDIGCSGGGLALSFARDRGAHVLSVTLSQEQLTEARSRAAAQGLSNHVRFELRDYRSVDQKFGRIVSVACLNMWASTITRNSSPLPANAWHRRA